MANTISAALLAVQNVLGRSPLRCLFEVSPQAVVGLPAGATAVSLVLERGSRVSYTDPAVVKQEAGTAVFHQVMKLTTTIYKQGDVLLPKLCTLKVQSLHTSAMTPHHASGGPLSHAGRTTIARAKLDLAQFWSAACQHGPQTAEIKVALKPQGCLTLSISTTCLQHLDNRRAAAAFHTQPNTPGRLLLQHTQKEQGQLPSRPSWPALSDSSGEHSIDASTGSGRGGERSHAGSCASNMPQDLPASSSAELDQLLRQAEAATAAKTLTPAAAAAVAAGARQVAGATTLAPAAGDSSRALSLGSQASFPGSPVCYTASTPGPSGTHAQPAKQHHRRLYTVQLSNTARHPTAAQEAPQQLPSPCSPSSSSDGCSTSGSSTSGRKWATQLLAATTSASVTRKRHRRVSSVPETATILEVEGEGSSSSSLVLAIPRPLSEAVTANASLCTSTNSTSPSSPCSSSSSPSSSCHSSPRGSSSSSSCTSKEAPPQRLAQQPWRQKLQQQVPAPLPFGMLPRAGSGDSQSEEPEGDDSTPTPWADAYSGRNRSSQQPPAAAEALWLDSSSPEGLRSMSGQMPAWLWPSSRLAVRELSTEQIMRRISSSGDAGELRHLCRGLLVERNEWRFRAGQAERFNSRLVPTRAAA